MKNLFSKVTLFFIIGILLLSIASCAKPYPKEPTDVVLAFQTAMEDEDYEGAKKYCTDNFLAKEYNPMQSIAKTAAEAKKKLSKEELKQMEEFAESMSVGVEEMQSSMEGNEAHVWVTGLEFSKMVLVKDGTEWKLDRTETDEKAMQEAAEQMMKDMGM